MLGSLWYIFASVPSEEVTIIAEYFKTAVGRDISNNLKFPNKCAYCLEPTPPQYIIVKNKALKGFELKVPYCETHSRMIRYMKGVHNAAFCFAILLGILLAFYFRSRQMFVLGTIGFNVIVGALIGFAAFFPVFLLLRGVVLGRFFPGQGSLDKEGAVEIVGVYADAVVLQFHNKIFGIEFSQLNYSTPIDRQK